MWRVAFGVVAVLGMACRAAPASAAPHRYARGEAAAALRSDRPGLVIGSFPLRKVIDGDTIRVEGLDGSLRLIGLDAEETFKSAADRREADADWPAYLRAKRGVARHPVKLASPLGEDARRFAERFFAGARTIRLERDDPRELRDRYQRHLAYAFVEKDGRWVNYAVECVRAGMSPYFTKYGYSKRFHAALAAAEREARAARRGIWAPGAQHYPDYAERTPWWNARADFIAAFERAADGAPDHVVLSHWDALQRLEDRVGQPVAVLGIVGDISPGEGKRPARVLLTRQMHADLPLIFFEPSVLARSGIASWLGEPVIVRGTVKAYTYAGSHHRELEIVIDRPGQIELSALPGMSPPRGSRQIAPAAPAAYDDDAPDHDEP
jgi:endonuclease YncB( thermonuclease family)